MEYVVFRCHCAWYYLLPINMNDLISKKRFVDHNEDKALCESMWIVDGFALSNIFAAVCIGLESA